MPDWYLLFFVISLVFLGSSTILFRSITVEKIKKEMSVSQEYYMSMDDKLGYSLIDISLSIILPLRWAKKIVIKAIACPDKIKNTQPNFLDKFLSYCFILSVMNIAILMIVGSQYI